ncbi:hypothetical protein FSARC_2077 [Fusarium sarcochroum]|uniref:N-acetyltransferase domain-containing protein n=1 Tax=Fusarium sarcochroum TaxID=1208366 RepID=A0A8H4U7J1_9HYPO|nr:hypothetical protein FSARC_2077 [Fusarium sarcochroum]
MSSNFHFRTATSDDAPHLQDLIQSAFRALDKNNTWVGSPELAASFSIELDVVLDRITSPDGKILIASDTQDGPAVGCVAVFKRSPGYGRLALLAVDPNMHRGGLGRQVLAYGEEYLAREMGVTKFGLNALVTRVELIKWYERQGYVKTGETSTIPLERTRGQDIPDELVFVEMDKNAA